MSYEDRCKIEDLIGKTFTAVRREGEAENRDGRGGERITFEGDESFVMFHDNDCCESVSIEDINGDLADLVGSPILKAEESTSNENPLPSEYGPPESFTWTFYHIATKKGYVTIRWYGTSNGCYSEGVDIERLTK